MSSFFIRKDTRRDNIRADQTLVLPITGGPNFPPNIEEAIGGGLLYNNVTQLVYYNDGTQWLPLTGGGGGSTIRSYALIKDGTQNVPNDTDTIMTFFDASPLPYHDGTGSWNLATGVYTAGLAQSLMVAVNISWVESISTVGRRYVQIIYKPSAGAPVVVKEAVTQTDPDIAIKTTQEATMILKLAQGDQVWVQVKQTSGTTVSISGGNETSLSGFESF